MKTKLFMYFLLSTKVIKLIINIVLDAIEQELFTGNVKMVANIRINVLYYDTV